MNTPCAPGGIFPAHLTNQIAHEIAAGPDDNMTLEPLWGLCDLYDRWDKPGKSQSCWHRATGIMEKTEGMNSPALKDSLTFEANAFRKLGRNDEAQKLEERVANIQKAGDPMMFGGMA